MAAKRMEEAAWSSAMQKAEGKKVSGFIDDNEANPQLVLFLLFFETYMPNVFCIYIREVCSIMIDIVL